MLHRTDVAGACGTGSARRLSNDAFVVVGLVVRFVSGIVQADRPAG
jgi:hypothetical protein